MTEQELIEKISAYLYAFLERDGTDMPADEYVHEAEALVDFINSRPTLPSAEEISNALRTIFIDRLGHGYGLTTFNKPGQDIATILNDYKQS